MIKAKKCPHFDLIKLRVISCNSIKDAYSQNCIKLEHFVVGNLLRVGSVLLRSLTKIGNQGKVTGRGIPFYEQIKCIKMHVVDVFVGWGVD